VLVVEGAQKITEGAPVKVLPRTDQPA
jgi:hypothetical protein